MSLPRRVTRALPYFGALFVWALCAGCTAAPPATGDGGDAGDGAALRPRWVRVDGYHPMVGHSTTRLDDGSVLLAGGQRPPTVWDAPVERTAVTFRFDPQTNRLQPDQPMAGARSRHRAVLLDDGRLLVLGGLPPHPGVSVAPHRNEIFDPRAPQGQRWQDGPQQQGPDGGIALRLPPGEVLAAYGGGSFRTPTVERFSPQHQSWTPLGHTERRGFGPAFVASDGAVLTFGGAELAYSPNNCMMQPPADPHLDLVERIDPLSGAVSVVEHLLDPRSHAAGLRLGTDTFLLIGGQSNSDLPHVPRSAERIDLASGLRTRLPLDDAFPDPRAVLLPSGRALIIGRRGYAPLVATLDRQGRYVRIDDPPAPAALGVSDHGGDAQRWQYPPVLTLLDDGTVLVSGNADGELWRFYPGGR